MSEEIRAALEEVQQCRMTLGVTEDRLRRALEAPTAPAEPAEPIPPPLDRLTWDDFKLVGTFDIPQAGNWRDKDMEGCAPGFTVDADGSAFMMSRRLDELAHPVARYGVVDGGKVERWLLSDPTNGVLAHRHTALKAEGKVGAQMGGLCRIGDKLAWTIQPRYGVTEEDWPYLFDGKKLWPPQGQDLRHNNGAGFVARDHGLDSIRYFGHVTSQGTARSSAGPALHFTSAGSAEATTLLHYPVPTNKDPGHPLPGWVWIPEHSMGCSLIDRPGFRSAYVFVMAVGRGVQGYKSPPREDPWGNVGPSGTPYERDGYWASEGYVLEVLIYDAKDIDFAGNPWEPQPYERREILDWPWPGTVPRIQGCDIDNHGHFYLSVSNAVEKKTPRVYKFAVGAE